MGIIVDLIFVRLCYIHCSYYIIKSTLIYLSLLRENVTEERGDKRVFRYVVLHCISARHNPSGASRHLPFQGRLNKLYSYRNHFGSFLAVIPSKRKRIKVNSESRIIVD